MKRFLVRYYNNGNWYGTHIFASDIAEAKGICTRHSLQLDGELVVTLRWPFGLLLSLLIK